MATEYWRRILDRNPQTGSEFMAVIYELKPDIDEHEVVRWQRASRDWTTSVFEFIWFQLKIRQGETKWVAQTEALWPEIKTTIQAENLEQLLMHMFI